MMPLLPEKNQERVIFLGFLCSLELRRLQKRGEEGGKEWKVNKISERTPGERIGFEGFRIVRIFLLKDLITLVAG